MRRLTIVAILFAAPALAGEMNQYHFFDQYNWGDKTGIFLQIHHPGGPAGPAKLAEAQLGASLGDGQDWHALAAQPTWKLNTPYTAKLAVTPGNSALYLDGKLLAQTPGNFTRVAQPANAAFWPEWGRGPAEYAVVQDSLDLTLEGKHQSVALKADDRPAQIRLLSPSFSQTNVAVSLPGTFEIEARFHFVASGTARELSPLMDPYFQVIQADYPGKIKSDQDLTSGMQQEEQRLTKLERFEGFDQFGGCTSVGWTSKATGFFRVEEHDGKWWLISPAGNPCFYTGMCDVPDMGWGGTPVTDREFLFQWLPPKDGIYKAVWTTNPWSKGDEKSVEYVSPISCNLIRKYGEGWKDKALASAIRRTKAMGFSGLGKWVENPPGIPVSPVLGSWDLPKLEGHLDVFDAEARKLTEASLRKQIDPRKADPYVVGWSFGNEYEEHIKPDEVAKIMKRDARTPAKRALAEHALNEIYGKDLQKLVTAWGVEAKTFDELCAAQATPPAADIETLRRHYQDKLYEYIYSTIKQIDPNHLFLATWIVPNWWVNEQDWYIIGKHCDVVGFDYYDESFNTQPLPRLLDGLGKPAICGEFSYAPYYDGQRGFGKYRNGVPTEKDTAAKYTQWMKEATANRWCVGTMWFQYRDQPITGRGPREGAADAAVLGENYAFGIVDGADRLKWELTEAMREANLQAARWRAGK